MTQKLGKLAVKRDPRNIQLRDYLRSTAVLPPAPVEASWVTKVPQWPMYKKDILGDCTIAAAAHMIGQWSWYSAGKEAMLSDQDILTAYEAVSGYVPGKPDTDNGAVMIDVLNYWRKTGIGGHTIQGYAQIQLDDMETLKSAVELFGNVYLGVALPISAQGEQAWTVTTGGVYSQAGAVGSWGGHCIPIVAYSPETFTVVTWGETLKMSHNFLRDYADEMYVVLSEDWVERQSLMAPSNINLERLSADLARM